MRFFCRWLMTYGTGVEIVSPDTLKDTMEEMLGELSLHYSAAVLK
jgi:hypothetical protein